MKNQHQGPRRLTIEDEIVDVCGLGTLSRDCITCTTASAIRRMILVTRRREFVIVHFTKCLSRTERYGRLKNGIILKAMIMILNEIEQGGKVRPLDWYLGESHPPREDLAVLMSQRSSDILVLLHQDRDKEECCSESDPEIRR